MKYKHLFYLMTILLVTFSCEKIREENPMPAASGIRIQAFVPQSVSTSNKRVTLDASRTLSLSRTRALSFSWSVRDYPPGISLPRIKDANLSIAYIDSLMTPGLYRIGLLVTDSDGNWADTVYSMEVIRDTLLDYPPRAQAGADITIMAPMDEVDLNGMETYRLNPVGRNLNMQWSVISQPAGSPIVNIITPRSPITRAGTLRVGVYQFRLEVENELGLRAADTLTVTVLPDQLTGTTLVFENQVWEKFIEPDNGWGEWIYVAIRLKDARFEGREYTNLEVRVWNESKQDWDPADTYAFEVYKQDGIVVVYYPWNENESIYFKDLGKKTRLQVKFL